MIEDESGQYKYKTKRKEIETPKVCCVSMQTVRLVNQCIVLFVCTVACSILFFTTSFSPAQY